MKNVNLTIDDVLKIHFQLGVELAEQTKEFLSINSESVNDLPKNIDFYTDILKVKNKNNVKILRSDIEKNTVLSANKKMPLLIFYTNQNESLELLGVFGTMEAAIETTYASIYDQKWRMKNMKELHISIER